MTDGRRSDPDGILVFAKRQDQKFRGDGCLRLFVVAFSLSSRC